ncbi:uncharacterized protein AAES06_019724 isoform 2-T2 [Glossophaga mutica]
MKWRWLRGPAARSRTAAQLRTAAWRQAVGVRRSWLRRPAAWRRTTGVRRGWLRRPEIMSTPQRLSSFGNVVIGSPHTPAPVMVTQTHTAEATGWIQGRNSIEGGKKPPRRQLTTALAWGHHFGHLPSHWVYSHEGPSALLPYRRVNMDTVHGRAAGESGIKIQRAINEMQASGNLCKYWPRREVSLRKHKGGQSFPVESPTSRETW